MDRRLHSILQLLNEQSKKLSQEIINQNHINLNTENQRQLIEYLNNFHPNKFDYYQNLKLSGIKDPISNQKSGYGEREDRQEVKAHLISVVSNRISSSSRSTEDNKLMGYNELSIPLNRIDRKFHDIKSYSYTTSATTEKQQQETINKEIENLFSNPEELEKLNQSYCKELYELSYYKIKLTPEIQKLTYQILLVEYFSEKLLPERTKLTLYFYDGVFQPFKTYNKQDVLKKVQPDELCKLNYNWIVSPLTPQEIKKVDAKL